MSILSLTAGREEPDSATVVVFPVLFPMIYSFKTTLLSFKVSSLSKKMFAFSSKGEEKSLLADIDRGDASSKDSWLPSSHTFNEDESKSS